MREILFRGKRTDNGEWVYGCLLNNKHDMIGFYNNAYKFEINEVIHETVGQFTGLTDKNGKKIFEGDILRYQEFKTIYVVKWCQRDCCFGTFDHWRMIVPLLNVDVDNYEIIGNIYDNPELLEK